MRGRDPQVTVPTHRKYGDVKIVAREYMCVSAARAVSSLPFVRETKQHLRIYLIDRDKAFVSRIVAL